MNEDIMINIDNVSYEYRSYIDESIQLAVKDLTLLVERGEFLAVLGHNGSGKSTLAKMINGLILPSKGDVFVNGMNTRDENKI